MHSYQRCNVNCQGTVISAYRKTITDLRLAESFATSVFKKNIRHSVRRYGHPSPPAPFTVSVRPPGEPEAARLLQRDAALLHDGRGADGVSLQPGGGALGLQRHQRQNHVSSETPEGWDGLARTFVSANKR